MAPSSLLPLLFVALVGMSAGHEVCRTILDAGCNCGACPWFTTLKPECQGRSLAYCARQGYFEGGSRAGQCCEAHAALWTVVTGAVGLLTVVVTTMGLGLWYLTSQRGKDVKAPLLRAYANAPEPTTPSQIQTAEPMLRGRREPREVPIPGSRI
jgi:hypothetical protein